MRLLILLLLASQAWALPQVSVRKVYGNVIFTAVDKNADETHTINAINSIITYLPGTDSLKITRVVIDSLHASSAGRLAVVPGDTLEVLGMFLPDSMWIGGPTPPVGVAFSHGASPGDRGRYPYLSVDSLVTTTTTTLGNAAADPVLIQGTVQDSLRLEAGAFIGLTGSTLRVVFVDSGTDTARVQGELAVTGGGRFGGTIRPAANDGGALGASGTAFSDLFLASGGIINWLAGDVLATHAADQLNFTGATSGYSFTGTHNITLGGATYGIQAAMTQSGTSNVSHNFTTSFSPSGASNDFTLQMLPAYTLDNAGSYSGIYHRMPTVSGSKTLASAYAFRVADGIGAGTTTVQVGLDVESLTTAGTNYAIRTGASGLVQVGSLNASQDVQTDGSKNLTTVSDSTWKVNLGRIDGDSALTVIGQLQPRYYKWRKSGSGAFTQEQIDAQPRLGGFFAQEVWSAYPEGSPGGANADSTGRENWGLNSGSVLAVTVAAGQRLYEIVDSLRVVTATQRAQIDSLKALH